MRILIYLGHPAHYHAVRHAAAILQERGHRILLAVRKKDVLLDLLEDAPFERVLVSTREGGVGRVRLVAAILAREARMLRVARRFRPDVMLGTDPVITHVGRLLRIPAVIFNEDDAREVPLLAHLGFRFAHCVLAPRVCDLGPYEHRKVAYEGYHELAYLHPRYFTPDAGVAEALRKGGQPYFVLRFARLSAHHDVGRTGLTDELALRLIERLSREGAVYISAERTLSAPFTRYLLPVHPSRMHHVLHGAAMYVGDSQTMTAEAAVLGTPALRFNDFVGRLGYLEELEHCYRLTFGIPTRRPEALMEKIEELLAMDARAALWQARRERMLAEKIDVTAFFVRFLEENFSGLQGHTKSGQNAA